MEYYTKETPPTGFASWYDFYLHCKEFIRTCQHEEFVFNEHVSSLSINNPVMQVNQYRLTMDFVKVRCFEEQEAKKKIIRTNFEYHGHTSTISLN